MSELPLPPRPGRSGPLVRRQPRFLTHELVIEAALAVLDRDGLDAVTMRAVAEQLGTGPASLYAHVGDKEEMIGALYDRVISEIELPVRIDSRRWQRQLAQMCHALRETLGRHRDIARAALGRVPSGERAMELAEKMLAAMRAGGVSEVDAAMALDMLVLYSSAVAFEASLEDSKFADADYHASLESYFSALPAERFPHLQAMATVLTRHVGDERFDFGLSMIISGLAATVR